MFLNYRSRVLITSFFLLIQLAKGANILGIFPFPGKSHHVMFERLMTTLAERGHSVDVVTQFVLKDVPANYNQISLHGTLPILQNNVSLRVLDDLKNVFDTVRLFTRLGGLDVCRETLKSPVLQKLKETEKKYDLVVTHLLGSSCMIGFAHHFRIPFITMITSVSLPWAEEMVGNPDNPSYIPNYFTSFTSKMTFWERIENTISSLQSKIIYRYYSYSDTNTLTQQFFHAGIPPIEDISKTTNLILVNSHFSMNGVRPTLPNFVEVGGLHIKPPEPLSDYFEKLLSSNSNGTIYLSMGSMLKTETLPLEILEAMFDAFSELPFNVLWKAVREDFPKGLRIPNNIYFETWMPQMSILCHPNVKLFVTHGGLLGAQEAVYCGVPRLGIPILADQELNIAAAEKMGVAIRVGYKEINKELFLGIAKRLLFEDKYSVNAKTLSELFKDRPMSALDTAVYWVEYVIRHEGAPHLKSTAMELTWYQYYLLDVAFILAVIILLPLLVLLYLVKVVVRYNYEQMRKI